MRSRTGIAFLLAACLSTAAACGSDDGNQVQPSGSTEYFFQTLSGSDSTVYGFAPKSLVDALPNHIYSTGETEFAHTENVVTGSVTDVRKGEARRHTADDKYETVDFDDPEADERSAIITVAVDEAFPKMPSTESIEVRVGLHGARDRDAFLESLASLGRVVIGLTSVTDGKARGTLIPALGGMFVGTLSNEGKISFAGIDVEHSPVGYIDGLDTLDELRAEASKPPFTTTVRMTTAK